MDWNIILEWFIAFALGGFVCASAVHIYWELTDPGYEKRTKTYNKSHDHYRDGDNT